MLRSLDRPPVRLDAQRIQVENYNPLWTAGNEMSSSKRRLPKRLVTAPPPSHSGLHSTVLDVECLEDQDVQWLWTETPEGRFVSGYQFVPRLKPPM